MREWASVSSRVAEVDLVEEVTSELRPKGGKGASHAAVWGKVSKSEGTADAKALRQDPEAGSSREWISRSFSVGMA